MNKQQAEAVLFGAKYIYAKTIPKFPHEYTLKKDWASETDFMDAVRFIRENGKKEMFFTKQMTYYYASDGNKYWSMGAPVEITSLINRAKVETK